MVVVVIVMYSFLAMYEFTPLYKQKLWVDFWVNATLWTCSLVIALLIFMGVEIPSPEKLIQELITLIFGK